MSWCGHSHAWGDEPCTIFTLDGLDFITSGSRDTPYGVSRIDGWGDGSTATGGPVSFPGMDGGFFSDVYDEPMSITLEGDIDCRDHQEYAEAVADLKRVLKRPRRGLLVGDESVHLGHVRQVEVTRLVPVKISTLGASYGIFTLELSAASSVLEGVDLQVETLTSGGTALSNIGDMDAALTLHIEGPRTHTTLSWPGGSWEYRGDIPAGQMRSVDMRRRVVRNPATSIHSRADAGGDWLQLPPGVTTVSLGGSGTGAVTARWRSAWA